MALNASSVAAGQALRVLEAGWSAQAEGRLTASWMLHGRPGVGKTEIVQTLADRIGGQLFDIRLTTIEPQDLRGLPYYDHESRRTVWYRPEDLPDDPARPAVLFLDELTAAQPYLQPTVYGLLQERRVGRHRLPDSTFIVAAGNTVDDGAVAYEMGTALSDRLIHLEVVAGAEDWLQNFALPRGLHPAVVAFIRTRPDLLETSEAALAQGHMIAATPRSWDRVSRILTAIPDRATRAAMVAGTVGDAVAAEFAIVADDIAATVQVTEMLAAPASARWEMYPATLHGLNALIYGLLGVLERKTAGEVIEILDGIRHLAKKRPEPAYQHLPLGELCTYGYETLIAKGLAVGLGEAFLASKTYRRYADERQAMGL